MGCICERGQLDLKEIKVNNEEQHILDNRK
jgi:hypothetical protein